MKKDDMGIQKGALGIRYLLQYLENGRIENFEVVRDCLNEIRLWILITFYANNIDYLINEISDSFLEDIFNMKPLVFGSSMEDAKKINYGRGFFSKSTLSYKEQFKQIRNALCHGKFEFKDGLIKIMLQDYQAIFDLAWLDKLTSIVLSNNRFCLQKGMSDISVLALPKKELDISQINDFVQKGYIYFYKVTSLTSNPETIKNAIPIYDIDAKECTFDFIFQTTIYLIQHKHIYSDSNLAIQELRGYFKEIEAYFDNHIKLDLLPVVIPDCLYQDEDFLKLSYVDKLNCLINVVKFQDPIRYNSICSFNLLQLLDEIEKIVLKIKLYLCLNKLILFF